MASRPPVVIATPRRPEPPHRLEAAEGLLRIARVARADVQRVGVRPRLGGILANDPYRPPRTRPDRRGGQVSTDGRSSHRTDGEPARRMDGRDGRRLGALEGVSELSRLVEDVREHPRAIDGLDRGPGEVVAHAASNVSDARPVRPTSVGAAGAHHGREGLEEDLHVSPQRPARDVQVVEPDHLVEGDVRAPVDLPQAGEAGAQRHAAA